ncbi:MAG: NADH-quinone oxidoreductase subunit J [Planctomycetota bacterium]|nr:NADH-quinone oxidoreductase subunit J [Planctomycetota bacterium]MDA1177439.1 NADH-quinone oxidoreductase subunit J [Planctomycetota bacterium]
MSEFSTFAVTSLLAATDFFANGWASLLAWKDQPAMWAVLGTMFLISGLWALQPGARGGWRVLGVLACLAGLGFCVRLLPELSGTIPVVVTFRLMASLALVSGLATVTAKNPVYSAMWFAVTLMGTAMMMLLLGGQFVAVATVAVYAGAIVVTFLFVLMLAQSSGRDPCDRLTWGKVPAWWAAPAAALLFVMICAGLHQESFPNRQEGAEVVSSGLIESGADHVQSAAASLPVANSVAQRFPESHVAQLGGQLFSRYLIPVQVVATLLLAALVGAVAIASYGTASGIEEQLS